MAMIPEYNTKLFTDLFPDRNSFVEAIKDTGLNTLQDDSLNILYGLLFAKYANSPIANLDENQSVMKFGAIVYQYGPTWEKKIAIQKRLRELNEEDLRTGATQITNQANNPEYEPGTDGTDVLSYVDFQSSNKFKKSTLEGYAILVNLLETDVTSEFISKFAKIFKSYVRPEHPYLYISEEEDE